MTVIVAPGLRSFRYTRLGSVPTVLPPSVGDNPFAGNSYMPYGKTPDFKMEFTDDAINCYGRNEEDDGTYSDWWKQISYRYTYNAQTGILYMIPSVMSAKNGMEVSLENYDELYAQYVTGDGSNYDLKTMEAFESVRKKLSIQTMMSMEESLYNCKMKYHFTGDVRYYFETETTDGICFESNSELIVDGKNGSDIDGTIFYGSSEKTFAMNLEDRDGELEGSAVGTYSATSNTVSLVFTSLPEGLNDVAKNPIQTGVEYTFTVKAGEKAGDNIFVKNPYFIYLDANGGSAKTGVTVPSPIVQSNGQEFPCSPTLYFNAPSPSAGYNTDKWVKEDGSRHDFTGTMEVGESVTLYAAWATT